MIELFWFASLIFLIVCFIKFHKAMKSNTTIIHSSKLLFVSYLVWLFINTVAWIMAYGSDKFFPFETENINSFDFSEFFVYTGLPVLLYLTYKVLLSNQPNRK